MRILFYCLFAIALLKGVAALCPSENVVEADGYRYSRVDDALYHIQAIEYCIISSYVNLAAIKTEVSSEAVDQLIRGCENEFYIGLQYENSVEPSSWYWADGSPLQQEQSRWESGYGNADDGKCACVLSSNQTWIDVVCGSMRPFICERNLVTIIPGVTSQWKLVGDNVTFSIRVLGCDGPVNLTMYKDQDPSEPLYTKTNATCGSNVEFKLESITIDDNGTYVFVASGEGYERRTSVLINVQAPVAIVTDLPEAVSSPVTRGPHSIECQVTGIPTPTVYWATGNNVTVPSREESTSHGVYQTVLRNVASLNITNAVSTDEGIYVCTARNTIRHDPDSKPEEFTTSKDTKLRVYGLPTIFKTEVINCTSNTLKVRLIWKADNQTHGINHLIKGRSYSNIYETNVTAFNQSVIHTDITMPPAKNVAIKVTVCPDDCITTLSNKINISFSESNPVTNANVTKVYGNMKESYCRVRWDWIEQNYTKEQVMFKVQRTSVRNCTRNSSDLSPNITSILLPSIDDYIYDAKVEPNTDNTFEVFVTNCAGDSVGFKARGECITGSAASDMDLSIANAASSNESVTTKSIVIVKPDERNGLISCLFVLARLGGGSVGEVDLEKLQTLSYNSSRYQTIHDGSEFIAVAISMNDHVNEEYINVVLGDNTTSVCNVYDDPCTAVTARRYANYYGFNWPLETNVSYSVSVVSTTPGDSNEIFIAQSETFTFLHQFVPVVGVLLGLLAWMIALIVVAVLLLLTLGIFIILVCKNKRYCRNNSQLNINEESQRKQPIDNSEATNADDDTADANNVDDASAGLTYSSTLHDNTPSITRLPTTRPLGKLLEIFISFNESEGRLFLEEFQGLKERANLISESTSVGASAVVKKKNRYKNVIPYDNSRVSLISDEGSDIAATYINASYIKGFERHRKFIATQGPLLSTIVDFWKMVMHEKARVIAMVTNLVEDNKKKCECYWPDVSASREYGNINVTTASQRRLGGITKRIFELTDESSSHRVIQYQLMNWPDHGVPNSTTNFLRFYKACMETQGKDEEPVIVHCSAGAGRTGTFIAYDYLIHEAMNHGVVDPFECVLAMRGQRMDLVQTSDQYQFIYRLVTEYQLFKNSDLDTNIFYSDVSANKPTNSKLRGQAENLKVAASFPKIAPEKAAFRIHVPVTWRPEDGENIPRIDAVRVETYDASLELIACIPPTKSTAEIFWRLNLDNEIMFIVSINDSSLDPQENVNECWPSEEHIKREVGSVSVTLLNADDRKYFQVNTIRVQRESSLQTKEIRQYNILKWKPKVALEVIKDVQSAISRMSTSKPRRTLVHCRREFGETGSFCALINLLSRMETEERVDVFRTAKDLKDVHVGLIQDQKQYKFCYDALRSCDHAYGRNRSESTSQYQNHSAYENEPATTGNRANGRKNSEKTSPSQNTSPYENELATTSL